MGGGDLNLKKSWHPHTMKNQEKVWKAEQAKNAEDRKMNDLRKEIKEEKNREELVKIGQATGVLSKSDDKKLEWMYKSSTELINREEYLLGRPIDKAFETLAAEEDQREKELVGVKVPVNHVEHECIPFSIRAYRNTATTEQVDLQRKILEDPLMMIKQKEMESRRKILENPVKLKELHRILKTEKSNKSKSKSSQLKKSKKSKKLKKKYQKSESDHSDSSDKDLDKMLQKQYKKLKGSLDVNGKQLAGLDLSKLLDAKYKTISKELDNAAQSKGKRKKSKKSANRSSSSSNPSESDSDENPRKRRNERNGNGYGSYADRSRSPVERRGYREERRRYSPTETKIYPRDRNTHTDKNAQKSKSQSPRRKKRSESRSRKRVRRSTSRSSQKKERREDRSSSQQKKDRRRDRSKFRSLQKIDQKRNRYRSPSIQKKDRRRDRSKSRSPLKKDRSSNKSNYSHSLHTRDAREQTYKKPTKKEHLTEEEKERRLKDMMENAAWHDKERTEYVQKYRDGYKQEEEQNKARDFDKQFINTQLRKAISTQNSVESRIRSNVNNIQRTSAAMNANFAKK